MFDLYRLKAGINKMLDQPDRITAIKRQLHIGQEISYFNERENRLVTATVEEIQRTRLSVKNKDDGKYWTTPFCAVNLDNVNTDIHSQQGQVDPNQFKVGDTVGFYDRQQQERYGQVVRLNQKTVTLHTKTGAKWRVAYSLLFKVMDGEGGQVDEPGLIEGQVVEIDGQSMIVDQKMEQGSNTSFDSPRVQSPFLTLKPDKVPQDTPSGQNVGRNAPCPCGSGRKFKRCCLQS